MGGLAGGRTLREHDGLHGNRRCTSNDLSCPLFARLIDDNRNHNCFFHFDLYGFYQFNLLPEILGNIDHDSLLHGLIVILGAFVLILFGCLEVFEFIDCNRHLVLLGHLNYLW